MSVCEHRWSVDWKCRECGVTVAELAADTRPRYGDYLDVDHQALSMEHAPPSPLSTGTESARWWIHSAATWAELAANPPNVEALQRRLAQVVGALRRADQILSDHRAGITR